MFILLRLVFFRGYSRPFSIFFIFICCLISSQIKGWRGLRFFNCREANTVIVFVILVIFFLCLNVSTKNISLIFLLFPLRIIFFLSQNILFFCLVFEWTIFPIILLIYWYGGQPERIQGFYYFLIFRIFSSYPFLVCFSSQISSSFILSPINGTFLIFSFLFPFLVKLPIFFLHSWLPKAHVEAPTLGSIILAGLILKFGVWGLYQMDFLVNRIKEPIRLIFLVGIILGAFTSTIQRDSKRLVAYSSICHINFLGFILFSKRISGGAARILIILIHGVTSSIIFWVAGGIYIKTGSRQIPYISQRLFLTPSILIIFIIIIFSNFGVPPTLGFWGEVFFLYVFFSADSLYFLVSIFYLILVCYFSIFFLVSLSRNSGIRKRSCSEESYIFCSIFLLFFFPILKICF